MNQSHTQSTERTAAALVAEKTGHAAAALAEFMEFTQEQVDRIVDAVARVGILNRRRWAKLAYEETGLGVVEDKTMKNFLVAEMIHNFLRDKPSVGLIEETEHLARFAEPVGVIAAILPCTNPTATPLFQILTAMKTRNPIIFSPHPRSADCSAVVCQEVYEAALAAGAPKKCIQWFTRGEVSSELVTTFMKDRHVHMIWAVGGKGLSHLAFSSGKPCIAGGSGNVPSYIEKTADIESATFNILMDKMFDNGATCTSTKGIIVDQEIAQETERWFKTYGAFFLNEDQVGKVEQTIMDPRTGLVKADFVAVSAERIARAAGIDVPRATKILLAPIAHPEQDWRLIENETITALCKWYVANGTEEAISLCKRMISHGGEGHTANIYTSNNYLMETFAERLLVGRVNVNMPSTFGAASDVYSPKEPTFTISCGSFGNNMTMDNITYKHFLNIKVMSKPRSNLKPFRAPRHVFTMPYQQYFAKRITDKTAMVITDANLAKVPFFADFVKTLHHSYRTVEVFDRALPDPDMNLVREATAYARTFSPQAIIAIGGGSPIDLAKLVRLSLDKPGINLKDLCLPFMDIDKKIYRLDASDIRTELICIPTTAGTGSEMTCAAVLTDPDTHVKNPIFDYKALFADVVILDGALVASLPRKLLAETGIDALVHAVEAYVSIANTPETDSLALKAIRRICDNLQKACDGNQAARAEMLYAAADAGLAITNAFVGVVHALGHQLGGQFKIPHGSSLAVFFLDVIRYNSAPASETYKLNGIPTYSKHLARDRYLAIARELGIRAAEAQDALDQLIRMFEGLMKSVGIATTVGELDIDQDAYVRAIETMAENAMCDMCIQTNPRYVLFGDVQQFFARAIGAQSPGTIQQKHC